MRTIILATFFTSLCAGQPSIFFNSNYTPSASVAATPTFSPVAGSYSGTQSVTISTATTPCANYIHYNTTGSPTVSDPTYSSPVSVAVSSTLYAGVVNCPGYADSAIGSAAYTITGGGACDPPFTENFGTPGALGSCWTPITVSGFTTAGKTIIASSGVGQVDTGFVKAAELMTGTFTATQSIEFKLQALSTTGNSVVGLVRADSSANGYGLSISAVGNVVIARYSNGALAATLADTSKCATSFTVGSTYKLTVSGSTLTGYKDGSVINGGQCTATNTVISTGKPALWLNASGSAAANVQVDDVVIN